MPQSEDKHYCVYYNNNYYDRYGNIVSEQEYRKSCVPEEKHYCVYYNNNYYDINGNIVSEEGYKNSCAPEIKHYCVYYNNNYYDKNGTSYQKKHIRIHVSQKINISAYISITIIMIHLEIS